MFDNLLSLFIAMWLWGAGCGTFYLISKLKSHLNFAGAFLIAAGGVVIFVLIGIFVEMFVDAICPKCYRYSPTFVWSWGVGGNKHLCEKCNPERIKEVFGDNLNYIEHVAKERKLI